MLGSPPKTRVARQEISIGGLSRAELVSRLRSQGVLLNAHAETLIDEADFDKQAIRVIAVTVCTVGALGRPDGR